MNADTRMGRQKFGRKILRPLFERIRSWPVPLLLRLSGGALASRSRVELAAKAERPQAAFGRSLVAWCEQAIGAILVRAGERLACVPPIGMATEPAPAAGTFGMAG